MHYVNVIGNPEMSKVWSLPTRYLQCRLSIVLKENIIRSNVGGAFRQDGMHQSLQDLGRRAHLFQQRGI